jgi:hypothetical protein
MISKDAKSLLLDISVHPFRGLTSRYLSLGFSGRRAEAAKTELVKKGLIKEVSIALGSHRPVKFLVLTRSALDLLKKARQDTKLWEYVGKASFEHKLYQVLIAYAFRKSGAQAYIERYVGEGKRLDVLVVENDRKVGIEVEMNPNIDLGKLLRVIKKLDELLIICNNEGTLEKITQKIDSTLYPSLRNKVRIELVKEYLASLTRNTRSNMLGKKSDY